MILTVIALALLVVTSVYALVAGIRKTEKQTWLFPYAPGRRARIGVFAITAVAVVALVSLIAIRIEQDKRRPSRYLIPEGYVGWVRIEFNAEDAPPLPIEDGYCLFNIPPSGLVETSSPIEYGWAKDEYYYYSDSGRQSLPDTGWGGGGMIWGGATGTGSDSSGKTSTYQQFFVGTEQQFREPDKDVDSKRTLKIEPRYPLK